MVSIRGRFVLAGDMGWQVGEGKLTLDAQGCYTLVDGVKSIFWKRVLEMMMIDWLHLQEFLLFIALGN